MNGLTWHKGCPVSMDKLRLLHLDYYDFNGAVSEGRMVVNRTVAADILGVFHTLFDDRFPMEHVDTLDLYAPSDRPTGLRNVTAAFDCRLIPGTSVWSQHAYGLAVDINPDENPMVKDGRVVPRLGSAYVDRTQDTKGMILTGDEVVKAFAGIGWNWGGRWHSFKDYMHFSLTGG